MATFSKAHEGKDLIQSAKKNELNALDRNAISGITNADSRDRHRSPWLIEF
jgi:hypothetical protein